MSSRLLSTTQPDGISVILPVYNEIAGIQATLAHLVGVLSSLERPYEILVVDDGSTDGSCSVIDAAASDAVTVIRNKQNQGYGASLTAGLLHARFPTLIITDADGTYPIRRIPDLLLGLADAVMVVGARTATVASTAPLRRLTKWCLRQCAQAITGRYIPDLNSGLRVIRREALLPLLPILPRRFSWTSTITVALLLQGQPVLFVPIDYYARLGVSKFHPVYDTARAIRCISRAAWFTYHQRLWRSPDLGNSQC